jgi:hypothetical protein
MKIQFRSVPTFLLGCAVAFVNGCAGSSGSGAIPDAVSGVVVDAASGAPVPGAEVGIDINERRDLPFIGPEGTPKPRYRRSTGGTTDARGAFSIDLRGIKSELAGAHPDEKWVVHDIHVYKQGYRDLFQAYATPGQTFKLEKK